MTTIVIGIGLIVAAVLIVAACALCGVFDAELVGDSDLSDEAAKMICHVKRWDCERRNGFDVLASHELDCIREIIFDVYP